MPILKKCESCHKRKFWTQKRKMVIPQVNITITSQSKLCKACFNGLKEKAGI